MNEQITFFADNPEYDSFVEKFEPKKTTDDCYTPEIVYDAVAKWVEKTYGIDRGRFVRPFYPGGDFETHEYPEGCVVVDNPPFSILSHIKKWYKQHGIKFFLFAPTLTLFSGESCTFIPVGVAITYANGANVNTSFVTNLEEWQVRTAPDLYRAVDVANKLNQREGKTELPKYEYPDEVITAAMVARWCKYGVEFRIKPKDCVKIAALDAQRPQGKTIFGSGFLLSERAAAERAAAERAAAERAAATKWKLSDRERGIVEGMEGER